MTFLALNGTTIPCLGNAVDEDAEEVGADRARMFDNTMRLTRRGLMRKWSVTTRALLPADALAVLQLINQGNALVATGDLVGSSDGVYVMPVPGKHTPVQTASGLRRRVTFVLEENPTPFFADRTASVYAFFKRGTGYLTGDWTGAGGSDLSGCVLANEGDTVSVWQDQSGNGFDLLGGINPNTLNHYHGWDATRDGNTLRFGNGIATGGGAPGGGGVLDGRTYYGRLDSGLWWQALTKAEIMVGVRASNGAPSSAGRNALWDLNRSGGGGDGTTEWPSTSGHVLEPACANVQSDYGDLSSLIDFGGLNVYDLSVDLQSVSPNYVAYVNNGQVFSATHNTAANPYFDSNNPMFGLGASGFFDGWYRDLVIFDAPLTPTQRLSWYRYLAGLDASPPI